MMSDAAHNTVFRDYSFILAVCSIEKLGED